MLKFLRRVDWLPLVSAALFYVLAIELMSSFGFQQYNQDNRAHYQTDKERIESAGPWGAPEWTALFTAVLTVSTIGLWYVTYCIARDAQKSAAKVRSIVRGGGRESFGVFQIEASNAGDGAASIQTVRWGFEELGKTLPSIPVYGGEAPGDALFAGTPYRTVQHVKIPAGFIHPIIFFRLEYFDVHQKKSAVIGHVLQIRSPANPMVPIQLRAGIPPEYLIDTFPLTFKGES